MKKSGYLLPFVRTRLCVSKHITNPKSRLEQRARYLSDLFPTAAYPKSIPINFCNEFTVWRQSRSSINVLHLQRRQVTIDLSEYRPYPTPPRIRKRPVTGHKSSTWRAPKLFLLGGTQYQTWNHGWAKTSLLLKKLEGPGLTLLLQLDRNKVCSEKTPAIHLFIIIINIYYLTRLEWTHYWPYGLCLSVFVGYSEMAENRARHYTINISSVSLNPRPRASNKKDARVIKGYTKSRPTL